MTKFFKFVFWRSMRISAEFVSYALFGICLAVIPLAFGNDYCGKDIPPVKETSPLLTRFLEDSTQTKIELTERQLSESVYAILLDKARTESNGAQSYAVASAPIFSAKPDELSVSIKASVNAFGRNYPTMFTGFYSFDGNRAELKEVRLGYSKIPLFLAAGFVEKLYNAYGMPSDCVIPSVKNINVSNGLVNITK